MQCDKLTCISSSVMSCTFFRSLYVVVTGLDGPGCGSALSLSASSFFPTPFMVFNDLRW